MHSQEHTLKLDIVSQMMKTSDLSSQYSHRSEGNEPTADQRRINAVTTNYGQGTVLDPVADASGIRRSICISLGRWGSADDSSACWEKFLCAVRVFQPCQFTRRQNLTLCYVLCLSCTWMLSKRRTLHTDAETLGFFLLV